MVPRKWNGEFRSLIYGSFVGKSLKLEGALGQLIVLVTVEHDSYTSALNFLMIGATNFCV